MAGNGVILGRIHRLVGVVKKVMEFQAREAFFDSIGNGSGFTAVSFHNFTRTGACLEAREVAGLSPELPFVFRVLPVQPFVCPLLCAY